MPTGKASSGGNSGSAPQQDWDWEQLASADLSRTKSPSDDTSSSASGGGDPSNSSSLLNNLYSQNNPFSASNPYAKKKPGEQKQPPAESTSSKPAKNPYASPGEEDELELLNQLSSFGGESPSSPPQEPPAPKQEFGSQATSPYSHQSGNQEPPAEQYDDYSDAGENYQEEDPQEDQYAQQGYDQYQEGNDQQYYEDQKYYDEADEYAQQGYSGQEGYHDPQQYEESGHYQDYPQESGGQEYQDTYPSPAEPAVGYNEQTNYPQQNADSENVYASHSPAPTNPASADDDPYAPHPSGLKPTRPPRERRPRKGKKKQSGGGNVGLIVAVLLILMISIGGSAVMVLRQSDTPLPSFDNLIGGKNEEPGTEPLPSDDPATLVVNSDSKNNPPKTPRGLDTERLVTDMRSRDEGIRLAAQEDLAKLGPKAIPVIRELLDDQDPVIRAVTLGSIQQMGPEAEVLIPEVVEMYEDKETYVVKVVSETLVRFGERSVEEVKAAVKSDNPQVRLAATMTIARMADLPESQDIIPTLIEHLEDSSNSFQQQTTATALVEFLPEATPMLIPLTDPSQPTPLRALTMRILASKVIEPTSEILSNLEEAFFSDQSRLRSAGLIALKKVGPEAAPIFMKAFALEDDSLSEEAQSGLKSLKDQAIPYLVEGLKSQSSTVRIYSATTLGEMSPSNPDEVVDALREAYRDSSQQVRYYLTKAINNLNN
ncbi:Hypothetical protein PBC10988_32050 [Planctomycetales bacterium 10988]|nr:Hypothetical protein PBC10988_32050 [Planctomycetales bacterium 10988]